MSGNKYLLFIQLCKELLKASKPSELVMPAHPTQIIPNLQQKMGQSRGKGLVQPLKSHSTFSGITLPPSTQHSRVGAALLGCFEAFQSSRSVSLQAAGSSLMYKYIFPSQIQLCNRTPSTIIIISLRELTETSGMLRWELIIHKPALVN